MIAFGGVLSYLNLGGQLTGEQYEYLRDMIAETRALKVSDKKLIVRRAELEEEVA